MQPKATTTGINFLGDLPWGTHCCYFFEGTQDLLDTVVPFLQAGLENHEFCVWSIYTPITEAAALEALQQSIPDLDRYRAEGAIEVQVNPEPLFDGDVLKAHRTVGHLRNKLDVALARGYSGLRVAGTPWCIQRVNTEHFREFERELGRTVEDRRIIALCYFPRAESSAAEILDAARAHQLVATRRHEHWEILETSGIKLWQGPVKKLNEPPGLNGTPRRGPGLRVIPRLIHSDLSLSRVLGATCGTLTLLLGLSVLLGWVVHSSLLIRLAPELPRMLIPTAVGFVLSGLALLGIAFNRPRLTLICSSLAALLGAAYLTIFISGPNPMTRPSAFCFVVLGVGFVLQQITTGAKRSSLLGVSGWLTAMVGAACAISVMWGSGDAFAMDGLTHMAFHTAMGFVFLGSGTLAVAIGMIDVRLRQPLWVSIGATVFLAVVRIELLRAFSPKTQTTLSSYLAWPGAMLGAVIFGVVIHLALKAHLQRQVLETVNRRLEEEMLERSSAEQSVHAAKEQLEQHVEERTRALEAANEELRRQKEILQTIFDHIPVMISLVGQNGQLELVNREWERTLGWTIDELGSRNIDIVTDVFCPDPQDRQRVLNFVANSTSEWADFKIKVKDGRPIETSWAVVGLSHGATICIGQDISERKQVEQELRTQKEILQTIFDHIPVMINFGNKNYQIELANREWVRVLGWSVEEILNDNVDVLAENYPDPEYRKQVRDFVTKSNGEWADFKTRVRDGRVIDTSWAMLYLSDGTSIGIGQDITNRKRAEEALQESEERFRQLAENIDDLFWIKSPDFKRVLYLSPAYESILGHSRYRDGGYQSFLDFIHPEDRYKMERIITSGSQTAFDVEFRIVRPDGSVRWIRNRGFPVRDNSGRVYRIAGIAHDHTERKLAEQALRESEERFRQLAENIREVFWLRSPDFRQLLYVSPMYEKARIHPEDRPRVAQTVRNLIGNAFEIEYRVITKEGEVRWVRDRGFPIRDGSGEVYRMGGVAEDITDRKEAGDRLKASSEQLRALSASLQSAREKEAARIARQIHDELGGILTGLRWELESLEKMLQHPADEAQQKMMRDKLTTMLGLTDTTIHAVRNISSDLRPSILDDLGLMEAVEWQTQQFQARTGIRCRCDCAVQPIPLGSQESTAVFRILQEALTNILRHAQATDVGVVMKEEDGVFTLTVADNGRGITTAEKLSRSSLGLLSMQERAHLIGGEVEITGLYGCGTTLRVRVPLSQREKAEGAS